MSVNPLVIEELRAMFREGATPSRLIQHIVTRHGEERNWHGLIQDYFKDAFAVPIVRGLKPLDNYHYEDLRYAFLNQDVLHEIIEKQSGWNSEEANTPPPATGWLHSLSATNAEEAIKKAESAGMPELADYWDRLDSRERLVLCRLIGGFNRRSEMVKILASLAERLQQRILELENELRKEREANQGAGVF